MSKKFSPAAVGAFVVGAVVLTVVAVVVLGSGRFFRTTYTYVLYFTGDVNGLNVGAPVKLKGVEIGSVSAIKLNVSQAARIGTTAELRIPVLIQIDVASLAEKGAKAAPSPENMKLLIERGLRGQLAMQSFVTGLLYIKMDFLPDTPVDLINDPSVPYEELPTVPTPLEEAQAKAAKFLAKLDQADLTGLVESLRRAIDGLAAVTNSAPLRQALETLPAAVEGVRAVTDDTRAALASVRKLAEHVDAQVAPLGGDLQVVTAGLRDALHTATVSLEQLQQMLQPEGPLFHPMSKTLADLSLAARAIRQVGEELERDPSVLLRGKALAGEAE